MQSMRTMNLYYPRQVVFGAGCIKQLAVDFIHTPYKRLGVISIPEVLKLIQPVLDQLKEIGLDIWIYDGLKGEPTYADFFEVKRLAEEFKADCIIGLGGGSVMDLAKIVAAMMHSSQELSEVIGIGLLKQRNVHLICVPTTSGTGSEMSPNSILLDESDNAKKGIISPFLVADQVYVDPALTLGLPCDITAYTAFDALTHCIEAYCNRFAHPMIDLYALEGVRLISSYVEKAFADGSDLKARNALSLGSMYGGMCLGPVNTAAVHALAYPLGSEFHLAHGLSNALLLPHVIGFNLDADYVRYANVAVALGAPVGENDKETALNGIDRLFQIMKVCGIPSSLNGFGIQKKDAPMMAEKALKVQRLLKNNLREIGMIDAVAIYENACEDHR